MSTRLTIPALIAVACVVAVTWCYRHAAAHRRSQAVAREQFVTTSNQLAELAALKSRTPTFAASDAPTEDLTRRISKVVTATGLQASVLSNVSPDADQPAGLAKSPDGKPLYLRRSARLTLDGVTLPQLGRFLERWGSAEQGWVVTSIDLTAGSGASGGSRIKTPEGSAATGRDRPLRALLAVEAIVAVGGSGGGGGGGGTTEVGSPTNSGAQESRIGARTPATHSQRDPLRKDPAVEGRTKGIEEHP